MSKGKITSMKIAIGILLLMLVTCAFQCENNSFPDESDYCSDTAWLQTIIKNAQQNTSKAEVIRYHYKNQTVYYVNTCIDCADGMAVVYNCSGQEICKFGGIAGFNTCPDFHESATSNKVIWSN